MIAADTSVLIDYFQGKITTQTDKLDIDHQVPLITSDTEQTFIQTNKKPDQHE